MAEAFAQSLAPKIENILTGSNLSSVSAKAVRKTLINEGIDESYIKSYKPQIDEVIKNIYLRLSTAAATLPDTPDQKPTNLLETPSNGGVKREPPTSSQISEVKRSRTTAKAKSAATVGSDEEGRPAKKKAKPRKKKKVEGEKSDVPANNPFNKPLQLSQALSTLLGESQASRPQVVKMLWAYIKGNGLQDPEDKRYILCDDKMMEVFKEPRVHMMTMNKVLSSHFSPLPVSEQPTDPTPVIPAVVPESEPLSLSTTYDAKFGADW
ncbi:hypothetical protein NliqN6_2389 [Naganishia liquefaciens]|uniref:DM2 domain-containing protein n=1 Tax=Naganishia liquefaciens TaxID=104408 RepID=A0A8H3TRR4_9TREE|nr:hypothetical protein NliqN6_2389 [Naganishia liquefaciens]